MLLYKDELCCALQVFTLMWLRTTGKLLDWNSIGACMHNALKNCTAVLSACAQQPSNAAVPKLEQNAQPLVLGTPQRRRPSSRIETFVWFWAATLGLFPKRAHLQACMAPNVSP
jgi:hypothetical protein